MVDYFEESGTNDIAVGFSIILPKTCFGECFELWKSYIFHPEGMHYRFGLDFVGFPAEETEDVETPTIEQWTNPDYFTRKPVLGTGVSISFHQDERD